jgi:hypothetical protein
MGEADWGYHIHYPGGACGSWCDFKRDHHLDKKTYGLIMASLKGRQLDCTTSIKAASS